MRLFDYVAERRGNAADLARALRVTPTTVSEWSTGKKKVPFEQCVPIEIATAGKVRRQDLKPTEFLKHWPELAPKDAEPANDAVRAEA